MQSPPPPDPASPVSHPSPQQRQLQAPCPLPASTPLHCPAGPDTNTSSLAVIGSWSRQVQLLALPGLTPVCVQELGSDIIPRSVALADFEGQAYVLCGLGDGQLHNWRLDLGTHSLSGEGEGGGVGGGR